MKMSRSLWAAGPLLLGLASPAVPLPEDGERTVDVIVLSRDAASAASFATRDARALGARVLTRFRRVPVSVVRIPASQFAALRSLPDVRAVEKDFAFSIDDLKPADPRFKTTHTYDLAAHGLRLSAVEPPGSGLRPAQYLNYLYTGAAGVWAETGFGEGSVVAVIDTGVHPVAPCLSSGQVLVPGFDVWGDNPATALDNAPHGTWVGNVIASACGLAGPPDDPLLRAVATHAPGILYDVAPGLKGFDIVGIAPGAKIYPVKAFQKNGDTTWAKILEAMDHVIDVKLGGTMDIDVVNLSLGKTALFDGREITDRFIDEMRKAGILVVCAAANEGPVPSTIATPGTSFSSLTAGGTDEAVSSRIFYEWLGLFLGPDEVPTNGDETPGYGLVMRPTVETRIVGFSSRGPSADGRGKPEISALAIWNFVEGITGTLDWVGGTSFATPTVAGGAALLNAYYENNLGLNTDPGKIRNALLAGADRRRVGPSWRDLNLQGRGVLWLPSALQALKKSKCLPRSFAPIYTGPLAPNLLGSARPGHRECSSWRSFTFKPGEVNNLVFEIEDFTSKITIEGSNLVVPANSKAAPAWLQNGLELHVQSAKRSWAPRPVNRWITHDAALAMGGAFTIEIEDGQWLFDGLPVEWAPDVPVNQPMEPGLMKLSLGGDWINEFPVSLDVRVARENFGDRLRHSIFRDYIHNGDVRLVPVTIPPGKASATFDLRWARDWSRFPTSDIDLILVAPDGTMLFDGATLNAPERAIVKDPMAGDWQAYLVGYQVDKTDYVRLYLTLE
jgi:subtilisin family serine protease